VKKLYSFNELSEKRCIKCGKPLKKRLVETREPQNIEECYECHVISESKRGHVMKRR